MGSGALDSVAFQRVEQAGWERKADGYSFYAPIAGYVVDPLLDTAGVGPAVRTPEDQTTVRGAGSPFLTQPSTVIDHRIVP